jgi:hypothetical protein
MAAQAVSTGAPPRTAREAAHIGGSVAASTAGCKRQGNWVNERKVRAPR